MTEAKPGKSKNGSKTQVGGPPSPLEDSNVSEQYEDDDASAEQIVMRGGLNRLVYTFQDFLYKTPNAIKRMITLFESTLPKLEISTHRKVPDGTYQPDGPMPDGLSLGDILDVLTKLQKST